MDAISKNGSALASSYTMRNQLATDAIRQNSEQQANAVNAAQKNSDVEEAQKRQDRKIPGLGNAVDISV